MQAPELGTAAGFCAVLAGVLGGVISLTKEEVEIFFSETLELTQGEVWNAYLVIVSVACVAYAAWTGGRGPAYMGALGLLVFALVVGYESNDVVGWPLLLLVVGAVGIALGLGLEKRARERPKASPNPPPSAEAGPKPLR